MEQGQQKMETNGTANLEIIIEKQDDGSQYPKNVDPGHTTAEINTQENFDAQQGRLDKGQQNRVTEGTEGTEIIIENQEALLMKKMEKKILDEGIGSDQDLIKHARLYKWAIRRDWKFVREYIKKNPNALFSPLSDTFETLVHVVAYTKEPEAVKLLRELMDLVDDQKLLERSDINGMTTLHYAAASGNAEGAKILLNKNKTLLKIIDQLDLAPLYYAAQSRQEETVRVLLESGEVPIDVVVVEKLMATNLFGIALPLIRKNDPNWDMWDLDVLFNTLAVNPLAFRSGTQLGFWQDLIYKCTPIESKDFSPHKYEIRDEENLFEDHTESTFLRNIFDGFGTVKWKVHVVIWKVFKQLVPGVQRIDKEKQNHNQAYLLLKHLCEKFEKCAFSYKDAVRILKMPVLKAATMGFHEFVNEVLEIYPNAFLFYDEDNRNVLQLAVLHRREDVFVGIMERATQTDISLLKDKSGNNLLHYATKLVPSGHIPGAALQMQKEMQWFKVLEGLVLPPLVEIQKKDEKGPVHPPLVETQKKDPVVETQKKDPVVETQKKDDQEDDLKAPWELFTKKHKELVKEGEEWMKNTATSCTVVAALITTVAFAAAFTIPGGIDENKGTPLFLDHSSLLTFLVADTLALISSSTSIFMFLGILTSRYSAIDFMESLPKKLMFGLIALFFSIASMITAFAAAIHIVLFRRFKWVDIPCSLIACFPVILFVRLQFPLLIDIYMSTYHSKICRLKRS